MSCTHLKCLCKVILMSTHIFSRKNKKNIFWISSYLELCTLEVWIQLIFGGHGSLRYTVFHFTLSISENCSRVCVATVRGVSSKAANRQISFVSTQKNKSHKSLLWSCWYRCSMVTLNNIMSSYKVSTPEPAGDWKKNNPLAITTLWTISADNKLMNFFLFCPQKIDLDISCKMSPKEPIFWGKNRKLLILAQY